MGQCRPTVDYRPNKIVPVLQWKFASAGIQEHTGLSRRAF